MSPSKQHYHHHHQKNKNLSSSANSTTSNSTSESSSPLKHNPKSKTTTPATTTANSSSNTSEKQHSPTSTLNSAAKQLLPQQQQASPPQNTWPTPAPINPNHTTPSTSSSSPSNNPYSTKSHHHHHHQQQAHHHSAAHREPRPSNSTRRASSNTSTTTALRHQHQQAQAQAQAQARAHAQVQAQFQAVQAHQLSYYQQHMADLATYITQVFLPSVLPTPEEYQIKEQTRQYLETLADRISKGARLLPFGSIASGLALRNSDMDLCYLAEPGNKIDNNKPDKEGSADPNDTTESSMNPDSKEADGKQPSSTPPTDDVSATPAATSNQQPNQAEEEEKEQKPKPTPAEMVMILGKLIQEETAFTVKMLPKARIPIIKLSLPPSLGQPFGLSCDIGFENRLALENTRLLLTYAMVDPRMRTMVLFLKVWSKRRRINDPYLGTLSSYGYVLMVIYYLVNGRKAPVLPNLQQLPPPRVTPPEDTVYEGHDIYFFDDLDALPRFWVGMNRENVGELLIEFFRFFSSTFRYTHDVISVRTPGGLMSKESKGWMHDNIEESKDGRGGFLKIDLNRLCIEDPFQTNYNVARTVTRDGLFTIRGEFMRAVRVLSTRTDRLDVMIRELCEERQEGVLMAPPSSSGRRKSAPNPNPKASLNMSISGSTTREEEEEEDDLEEQLLLQQQQQALMSSEQQPSYPPLTTRLMQDHIYSQATSSMDARPRYPPESIASEPPPLDRDLDWNHESISGYLSSEIQQLQLQQHQLQQQASTNPQSLSHPVPHVSDSYKSSKPATSAASAGHYFHRFFQTAGSENWNAQASTSSSLHQSSMASSPAFFYDSESLDPNLPLSPTSIPKHSSGGRRQKAAASEINRDELGSNSRGLHASTSSSSKSRYNNQTINSGRPPRSMSHSTMNPRRRSEQPQSAHQTLLNSTGPPIIMSSNGRMPDFSLLPLPGPIRFGNFGTTERLPKQKFDSPQRVLGRSVPAGYYHHTNGYPSTSFQQHELSSHQMMSLTQDMIASQRADGTSEEQLPSHQAYQSSWQGHHDPQREGMFLAALNESARRRSLSNGATSTHSSAISFDELSKPRLSLLENEDEGNRAGVETPRARSSLSPVCVGGQSTRIRDLSEHRRSSDRSTSSFTRGAPSNSSLSQLPRKIVFGDVEVSTETAKEVRVKALAAVMRTRRMGSLNNHSSRRSEVAGNVVSSDSSSSPGSREGRSRVAGPSGEVQGQPTSAKPDTVHSSRSSSARSHQHPGQKSRPQAPALFDGHASVSALLGGEEQQTKAAAVGPSSSLETLYPTPQSPSIVPAVALDSKLRCNTTDTSSSSRSASNSKDRPRRASPTLPSPSTDDRPQTAGPALAAELPVVDVQEAKTGPALLPAVPGSPIPQNSGSPPLPASSSVTIQLGPPQLDHPII